MRTPGSDMLSSVRLPETASSSDGRRTGVVEAPLPRSAQQWWTTGHHAVTGKAGARASSADRGTLVVHGVPGGFHNNEAENHRLTMIQGQPLTRHVVASPRPGDVIASVNGVPRTAHRRAGRDRRRPGCSHGIPHRSADGPTARDSPPRRPSTERGGRRASIRWRPRSQACCLMASSSVKAKEADAEHREVAARSFSRHSTWRHGRPDLLLSSSPPMMGLVLGSRRREFTTFRTLGATPWQLTSMFSTEESSEPGSGAIGAPLGIWVASLLRSFCGDGVVPSSLHLVVTPWAGAAVALIVLCALAAPLLGKYLGGCVFVRSPRRTRLSRRPVGGWRPGGRSHADPGSHDHDRSPVPARRHRSSRHQ